MRGQYKADFQWASLTTAQTLCTLATTASICDMILSTYVTTNNTTNQAVEVYWQRTTNALAGTGITTATVAKAEVGDQAAASTFIYGSSSSQTEPTYTANTQIGRQLVASLAGYQYAPVPEERPIVPPSAFIGLKQNLAITSSNLDVEVNFVELG